MDEQTQYVEKLSAQMVEWENQIDELKDKAEHATPEMRFEYAEAIAALQLKLDQAAEKLQGISTASEGKWEDMKEGAEQIWREVKNLFNDTFKKIR